MTDTYHDPLWGRIRDFELDIPGDALTFSRRLTRDNGWTSGFTLRVIEEYKRFCYLARRAGHPVTPSEEVDQAWHLHLAYTRSYWQDFCGTVLEAPLHHGPTRGGAQEADKYIDWYAKTLASYERFFGTAPPGDIWPDPAARFQNAAAFRRVDTAGHWVIRKPALRQAARWGLPVLLLPLVLTACIELTSEDPLGWLNGPVVFVLIMLLAAVSAVGGMFFIPDMRRGRKRKGGDGRGSGCGAGGGCSTLCFGGGEDSGGGGGGGCGGGGCGGGD